MVRKGTWPFKYDYYQIHSVEAKPQHTNLPIVVWDIEQYATTFQFDVEERDNLETIKVTNSTAVEFATNFGIEATILEKLGLKFGISAKRTETVGYERSYTKDSYKMGTVIVNFQDKVLLSSTTYPNHTVYSTREYSNGIFSIGVEPKKVQ